jgi:hypothetical protein
MAFLFNFCDIKNLVKLTLLERNQNFPFSQIFVENNHRFGNVSRRHITQHICSFALLLGGGGRVWISKNGILVFLNAPLYFIYFFFFYFVIPMGYHGKKELKKI